MNGNSSEVPGSFRQSVSTSSPASANMSQIEDTAKRLPSPATPANTSPIPETDYHRIFHRFHQHAVSDSTTTIGSNDSSPTTTISTVDDSSATDPSPGSSPESPPPTTFAVGMLRPRPGDENTSTLFELQKQPPPRKGRNLKNLAVNTSRQQPRAASMTSLPLEAQPEHEASIFSPSFVKPPTPPRRRPSNLGLTITTVSGNKPPPLEVSRPNPPSTPALSRPGMLRHFQSSPSLPLVPTLRFPHRGLDQSLQQQKKMDTLISPVEGTKDTPTEDDDEQNFDIPLSQEEKPEAYPDGPICVYDPGIDLYLEPTAEQARTYDVIMNVASEVRNPFLQQGDATTSDTELRLDGGGGIQYAPRRSQPPSRTNSNTVTHGSTPTTPKATSMDSLFPTEALSGLTVKDPEYIHIPWEHNSDIVPDLLRLVKVVDEKVNQGKRVLVHCQCGVSRSASLVVAYGLYKDPTLSVQEAYDAVKKRSKWIGPNMNLIMQLQEFRSSLERGGVLSGNRGFSPITPSSAMGEWRSPFSLSGVNEPLSGRNRISATRQPSNVTQAISPGPSSAPSTVSWPMTQRERSISAVKPSTAYVDPSGHVVPVLKIDDADTVMAPPKQISSKETIVPSPTTTSLPCSSTSAEFAMTPLLLSEEADPADSFGIMSPSSTEFATNSFDRSALLASLGMGSMRADEETPRRSLSLREPSKSAQLGGLKLPPGRGLRGKISSPTLREQEQLQKLQAKIEAKLLDHNGASTHPWSVDDALLSPRATEFTSNPFALSLTTVPPSPQEPTTPTVSGTDPRSPAQKGASPIIRSILDVL